jgi:hypothetical protein
MGLSRERESAHGVAEANDSMNLRDPIAAADLSRIRAADAVLAAAQAWEHATNGRPMSEQELRLRESVRAMRERLKEQEAKR